MVNFHDPAVIAQDLFAILKLWHALSGLYIWEFVINLDFEWNAIRGNQPYRWTIWIYSITRLATLVSVIFILIDMDITTQTNCQVQDVFQLLFGYVAFAGASLLIVLRNIAIWNGKKLVIAITAGVWVVNIGFFIQSIVRIRSTWVPQLSTCVVSDIQSTKFNIITTLVTDVTLLLIMLIGLLRLGFHERGVFGLGRLMWRQGLVWLFLATIAEVPPVVFISLDLNDPLDYMFPIPAMIIMTIAATRIYRSLVDFSSTTTSGFDNFHSSGSPASSKGSRAPTKVLLGPGPMEVAVRSTYDQSQTTQTSSQC